MPQADGFGAKLVRLDALLSQSDFIGLFRSRADDMATILEGRVPANVVNPEVLKILKIA